MFCSWSISLTNFTHFKNIQLFKKIEKVDQQVYFILFYDELFKFI